MWILNSWILILSWSRSWSHQDTDSLCFLIVPINCVHKNCEQNRWQRTPTKNGSHILLQEIWESLQVPLLMIKPFWAGFNVSVLVIWTFQKCFSSRCWNKLTKSRQMKKVNNGIGNPNLTETLFPLFVITRYTATSVVVFVPYNRTSDSALNSRALTREYNSAVPPIHVQCTFYIFLIFCVSQLVDAEKSMGNISHPWF